MHKHAYLILAHEDTAVLRRLLSLIDHERNDIFIHLDKNSKNIRIADVLSYVKKSKVNISRKYRVHWGTNSIALATLEILKKASKGQYNYYHVISGADLPIKNKEELWEFFEKHEGKEFIHFGTEQYQKDISCRYNQYHFFSKQLGRKRDKKFWVDMETYSLAIQRRLHIDRTKKVSFRFYGGANWVSITNGLAQYIVKNIGKYRRSFRFTQNSDELVFQTIVMDSPYKDNLYHPEFDNDYQACVRYIDWNRGAPYVFRRDDYEELMASTCMFARKFDEKTDKEIIEKIYVSLK
ncbi:MAG: hypothetical protein IKU39_04515 [Lachnospiraceae bacterium]|nr:hypothetical protein [Lachnospiraceae bacterium]